MSSYENTLRSPNEEAGKIASRDNIYGSESDSEPTSASPQDAEGDERALDSFIESHNTSPATFPSTHLPCPIVIPQRRPGNKTRGFVEAYAPVLEQFGIQQDEFISFIRAINKAVQASKWLAAIQLAATGTSFVPNPIAMGASVGVQVVAAVMAKAETRWKTNSFLDRVNDEFFRPRGLYCLLMSYNPIAMGEKGQLNDADAVSKTVPASPNNHSLSARAKKNLRNPVAGISEGEESLPSNVAELVYPVSSAASETSKEPKRKRDAMKRLNKYFDDRAQARYANESKGDVLSSPSPRTFKNRYLDPNHPATNGGLLGLVSGGYLTPDPEKARERTQSMLDIQNKAMQEQQTAAMANLRQQLALANLSPEQEQTYIKQYEDAFGLWEQQMKQQADLMTNGVAQRRILRNILYLMIVEIPSQEEIAKARSHLEASNGARATSEVEMRHVAA